jgi:hypothetical protein
MLYYSSLLFLRTLNVGELSNRVGCLSWHMQSLFPKKSFGTPVDAPKLERLRMNSIRSLFRLGSLILTLLFLSSSYSKIDADNQLGTCSNDLSVCTLDYTRQLKPWMHDLYERTVACRNIAETHPFINAVGAGEVSKAALLFYFQGMYWHGKIGDY